MRYANVVSSLALFLSLGGAAYAAGVASNSVGSSQVINSSLTGSDIKDKSLSPADIVGLPTKTAFSYRDQAVKLSMTPDAATLVAKVKVPAGKYLILGQAVLKGASSANGAVCLIYRGTGDADPLLAYGHGEGAWTNLSFHGPTGGTIAGTELAMYCYGTGPGEVELRNARITAMSVGEIAISSSNAVG
jgi:hypothetical protein